MYKSGLSGFTELHFQLWTWFRFILWVGEVLSLSVTWCRLLSFMYWRGCIFIVGVWSCREGIQYQRVRTICRNISLFNDAQLLRLKRADGRSRLSCAATSQYPVIVCRHFETFRDDVVVLELREMYQKFNRLTLKLFKWFSENNSKRRSTYKAHLGAVVTLNIKWSRTKWGLQMVIDQITQISATSLVKIY